MLREIFRLVDGKFIFPQQKLRSSRYLDLLALEKNINSEAGRLLLAEEELDAQIRSERDARIEAGRLSAKTRLREIDPTFSGADVDPQNVKVIFHPTEFIVFHGHKSSTGMKSVEFVSRAPKTKAQEKVVQSIDKVVLNGDVVFETLRVSDDGTFQIKRLDH